MLKFILIASSRETKRPAEHRGRQSFFAGGNKAAMHIWVNPQVCINSLKWMRAQEKRQKILGEYLGWKRKRLYFQILSPNCTENSGSHVRKRQRPGGLQAKWNLAYCVPPSKSALFCNTLPKDMAKMSCVHHFEVKLAGFGTSTSHLTSAGSHAQRRACSIVGLAVTMLILHQTSSIATDSNSRLCSFMLSRIHLGRI